MMTRTDTLAAWLAQHPTARRALTLLVAVHTLCLWAVITAPSAAAATGAAALGWTGLHDTEGVPLKDYFLSVVDTSEAITNNGQDISLLDPSTIVSWTVQAAQTAATHSTAAWWLTNEAAAFIFVMGISLWFLRFALSSAWLVTLAQIGRPIYDAVSTLVNQMWLGPIAVTLCFTVAGFHMLRGHRGRGWAIIGTGIILTVLLLTLFRDPITDLYSDHGLLAIGRSTGFQIAQASRNGSYYAPGQSLDAQLDSLLAELITAGVRHPLQVQNFGIVVDDIGNCRGAWSTAIRAANGQGAGPAHAMGNCGAPQALAHAQQLGANDFVLGLFFMLAGIIFGLFLWYVGVTNLLVGVKALYFGIVVGPAFLVGITGFSRAAAYAKHCGWQLFVHAVQLAIFTAFLGIVSVWLAWAMTTTMLGSGSVTVVPRMLVMMLGAFIAALAFRFIDKSFHTDGIGTIGHQLRSAWHAGGNTARRQYDDARESAHRARRFGQRARTWGRGDSADSDGAADGENGPQTPGFDTFKPRPVSRTARATGSTTGPTGASPAAAGTARAGAQGAQTAARAGAASEGAAVAEGAAAVAAPEVVIPAAVAAAGISHVAQKHKQHQRNNGAPPSARPNQPAASSSRPPLAERANGDQTNGQDAPADPDLGHRTLATPNSSSSSTSQAPGTTPASSSPVSQAYDVEPTGVEAPPIEQVGGATREEPTDPPLEFRSTAAPRNPATPRGDNP